MSVSEDTFVDVDSKLRRYVRDEIAVLDKSVEAEDVFRFALETHGEAAIEWINGMDENAWGLYRRWNDDTYSIIADYHPAHRRVVGESEQIDLGDSFETLESLHDDELDGSLGTEHLKNTLLLIVLRYREELKQAVTEGRVAEWTEE